MVQYWYYLPYQCQIFVDPNSSGGGRFSAGSNNQDNQVTAGEVNCRIVELMPTNQVLLDTEPDV